MIYFYITVPPNLYYQEFDFDFIRGMMQEMKDEYKVEYKEGLDKSLKYPRQRIYTQLHTDMSEVANMLKLSNEKHYERVKKHLDACNQLAVENSGRKKQFTVCNFKPNVIFLPHIMWTCFNTRYVGSWWNLDTSSFHRWRSI